jgi:hypothetical protein
MGPVHNSLTINIGPKEGDEREFLFAIQVSHNEGDLGSINPDLDGLHGDTLIVRGLHAGCQGRAALARARRSHVLAPGPAAASQATARA